jgi:outer membrane scaffolding protein for murein synthesis (MipA/OmpV family)
MKYSTRSAIAGFACAAILPLTAWAELTNDPLLGPGLRSRPAYDGAASQHLELVPVVRYFGPLLFVRSTQGVLEGGLRTEVYPGLHVGAQVAYEPGRRVSESDFLQSRNLPGIKRGASIGLQAEWDHTFGPVPITLLGRARRNIDSDLGTQVDLRLSAGAFHSGRFNAGVFTQAIWGSAKSAAANYAVTPQQSVASGLATFQPGSGWLNASVGLLWSVDLTPKWVVVGSLERRRLVGDAADSPLAQRLSNNYITAGVAYRF